MTQQCEPETSSERVALVVWYMAHGMALAPSEVVKITGLSSSGAWRMMCAVSRVIPIYQDDAGIWRVLRDCRERKGRVIG